MTRAEFELAPAAEGDLGRGLARLGPEALEALGLRPGSLVALDGRAGRAVARAMPPRPGDALARGALALDPALATLAGARTGERLALTPADLPPARRVRLAAEGALPPGIGPAGIAALAAGRPLALGTRWKPGEDLPWLEVCEIEPGPAARLLAETEVALEAPGRTGPYPGIGGLDAQIAQIREMVDLPQARPDLFARLGIAPPRGVLFTGPPGVGKTLLARAAAQASGRAFFRIDGPEIVAKHYGESESRLREIFAAAERRAPALIFIDEIDAIAPKRDALSGEKQLERRLVAQLLTLMDGLAARGDVVLMAATNLPHMLDPALRRPGRFDREVVFSAPDRGERRRILDVHLGPMPLAPEVDLDAIAGATSGYVGADLAALAREAGLAALRRAAAGAEPAAIAAEAVRVLPEDMETARRLTGPSALRETRVELPDTRWTDIGGLAEAKRALTEAVIWPRMHAEAHARLGLRPAAGVLLAGPPGGGKTLLARALAGESGLNLVALRASQILGPYLGEAERRVAEIFARARHAAPCLIFFDEIDAVAPARTGADPALVRLVAQLLTEIDGLESRGDLVLLGATNRLGAVDPALIRPGRFDRVIEIGPPDAAERAEILALATRAMPLSAGVDLASLAAQTEGWSGADLVALAEAAARAALRRGIGEGALAGGLAIGPDDIATALAERRASDGVRRRATHTRMEGAQ